MALRGITRREALCGAAALAGAAATRARAAADLAGDPFHDPSYSFIQPRSELVKRLSAEARQAQEQARTIGAVTVTGLPLSLPGFDDKIIEVMQAGAIPGVALCIARNDRILCTRGYGRASLLGNVPVEPTMPATIMSVSKALTATAALTLVRDQKLGLNDLAFPILRDPPILAAGETADPRQHQIQVHHLMSHTSGLFNVVETLNDPPRFERLARAGAVRLVHGRIAQNDLVRVGMKERLLFAPGGRYSYSGQGMQVLARIVEKVSGLRLDRYIHKEIFEPLGVRSYYVGSYLSDAQYRALMRPNREQLYAMCPTLRDERKHQHAQDIANIGYVSWGQADACGWASLSALDLLRLVSSVPTLIGPALWQATLERPFVTDDKGQRVQGPAGLGWFPIGGKGINHEGAWPGERSFAERHADGGSFALLVNSEDDGHFGQIINLARAFLRNGAAAQAPSSSWRDYGYPA
jgi:CubicO group peptidase (beta-lactamase class C family)